MKSLINILYEDDQFVVFDKPPGILVIPTPKKEKHTLNNLVNECFKEKTAQWHLHPCHRLDRDTSGLIVFAKGKRSQRLMMDLFQKRTVQKKYIAFIHGKLSQSSGTLKGRIQDFEQRKYNRSRPAQMAISHFKVVAVKKQFSVIEVFPVTGRTNQIRIQFSQLEHPLVGERKYAFARDFALKFHRTALHASGLHWNHPLSNREITVQSPLPNDMEVFLAKH